MHLRSSSRNYLRSSLGFLKCRYFATSQAILRLPQSLVSAIQEKAAESKEALDFLRAHSKSQVAVVTVQTALSGMRGAQVLVCETSTVDPIKGLAYRGHPLQELLTQMPGATSRPGPEQHLDATPSSESLLWLLLAGRIPTADEAEEMRQTIAERMKLPEHVQNVVHSLPTRAHPMTQLITGVTACQTESVFTQMYGAGTVPKTEHWKYALEDGLTLLAKLPALAGLIYRRISAKPDLSPIVPTPNMAFDWAGNISYMLGFTNPTMVSVMRLYMFLHADHEGGNVSAHAGHLVSSALADPYLSYTASMAGLAGPLHGLANQQSLMFFRRMRKALEESHQPLTAEAVRHYIETTILKQGQVVPGFGHAVLRVTDPRFTVQYEFAKRMMRDSAMFKLLQLCLDVVPPLLQATGKVANPYPNVDAHSGLILDHFGLQEEKYFTVLFGVSRCIGIISQIVWDRLLNLPIERPKSVTLGELTSLVKANAKLDKKK